MTTGVIDPRYGDASATPPPWAAIERLLMDAQLYWIITVRTDGRPHAVPLVGVWYDAAFAFCTGSDEQKQRNVDTTQQGEGTTRAPRALRLLPRFRPPEAAPPRRQPAGRGDDRDHRRQWLGLWQGRCRRRHSAVSHRLRWAAGGCARGARR